MKLYYSPGACSLASHITLYEIGLPFEAIRVPIGEGAHQQPDYLAINPRAKLPSLDTGRFVLTECPALLTWLAQSHPDSGLYPTAGSEAAGRCAEWLSWLASSVHIAFAQLWRGERFSSDESCHGSIAQRGQGLIGHYFGEIEQRLSRSPWACGEQYSVADPYLLVFYRWGDRLGFPMRADYPHWTAQVERLGQRPAVQAALAAEGISLFRA